MTEITKLNHRHAELLHINIIRVRHALSDLGIFDGIKTSDDSNAHDLMSIGHVDFAKNAFGVALHLLETAAFDVDDALTEKAEEAA